jgi:hypothetical protein
MNDKDCPVDSACTLPAASQAPERIMDVEVCVVGGGIAGLCAALASARSGAETILIQDRPVLGGNASSEVRMWICGAHGPLNKETGILEELQLSNLHLNPGLNYSMWDHVLYGAAFEQERLNLQLNTAVCEVEMEGEDRIASVRAWQLTRQSWLKVRAKAFIDCSGDSILRLSGAPCRWGREARSESGEPQAQDQADRRTMGNTILIQLRKIDPANHREFVSPVWAEMVTDERYPNRKKNLKPTGHNFWWLELGGMEDTIEDAETLRDRLLALAYGVWAYIKNHPDGRGHAWELEWVGSLPGKRENVRYEGDHILSQFDIESGGRFEDVIAHGGWTMDDHPPGGFLDTGSDTPHYSAPSPYGIPYRCLYSRQVLNLWFAGRNISATHMALSSTRVMGTTATLGQAAGTAAAIAVRQGCDNRSVYTRYLERLQRDLMDQDQWLPGLLRPIAPLSRVGEAELSSSCGDAEVLRDGHDRPEPKGPTHRWDAGPGGWVAYTWSKPMEISRVRITADSGLHDVKRMPCSYPVVAKPIRMPATLPRDLHFEALDADGNWRECGRITDNTKRLIEWHPEQPISTGALRLVVERGWDETVGNRVSLFSFEVGEPTLTGPIEPCSWPEERIAKKGLSA